MHLLGQRLPGIQVVASDKFGLSADWIEAVAFAWLARQSMNHLAGNLPEVTGAQEAVVLGAIYPK